MSKCIYAYGTKYRCKNNGYPFCGVHRELNNTICGYCKHVTPDIPKIRLSKCNHLMCITCFVRDILDVQFFEGFTHTDSLFCSCCLEEIDVSDWNTVIGILVKMKIIQPEFIFNNDIYNTYRVIYKLFTPPLQIDTSYRISLSNNTVYI